MTTIAELVLAQLERGEPVAVRSGATDWSAHQLRDWSAGIAGFLASRGIGRGDHVPVLGARGGALVAAWLGVLRSGAAFAPARVEITDGPLKGNSYKTPTAAARAVVRAYNPQVNDNRNGWGFWQLDRSGPRTWLQALRPTDSAE